MESTSAGTMVEVHDRDLPPRGRAVTRGRQAEGEPGPGGFDLHQLNLLCQYSYGVARADQQTRVGRHEFHPASLGSYWIIRSLYCPRNGFEGMVAASDQQGEPDFRHLTVVYAGTNLKDDAPRDILAALTTFLPPVDLPWGQIGAARAMADDAMNLATSREGMRGEVLFSGHSMGGGLALMQATRLGMPARVFCAVDPWLVMDRNQRGEVETHRSDDLLLDYRLNNDLVTGTVNHLLTGCADRSARVVWCGKGANGINHWLGHFSFDDRGNLITRSD